MTRRITILSATLFVASFGQSGRTSAQAVQVPIDVLPGMRVGVTGLTQPVILEGANVGFRVTRMDGQIPVGEVVVKVNGVWISPEIGK